MYNTKVIDTCRETLVLTQSDGRKVYVNKTLITSVSENSAGGSRVDMLGGQAFEVVQQAREIAEHVLRIWNSEI